MSRRVAASIAEAKANSAAKSVSSDALDLGDDSELFEFYAGGAGGKESRFVQGGGGGGSDGGGLR